jgi:hypothetical protein
MFRDKRLCEMTVKQPPKGVDFEVRDDGTIIQQVK